MKTQTRRYLLRWRQRERDSDVGGNGTQIHECWRPVPQTTNGLRIADIAAEGIHHANFRRSAESIREVDVGEWSTVQDFHVGDREGVVVERDLIAGYLPSVGGARYSVARIHFSWYREIRTHVVVVVTIQ